MTTLTTTRLELRPWREAERLPAGHPLRHHVLYRLTAGDYRGEARPPRGN